MENYFGDVAKGRQNDVSKCHKAYLRQRQNQAESIEFVEMHRPPVTMSCMGFDDTWDYDEL